MFFHCTPSLPVLNSPLNFDFLFYGLSMRIITTILTAFLLFSPHPCFSDEMGSSPLSDSSYGLEDEIEYLREEFFIVSATKHKQRHREAPAIASVITAEQIRNMGARNLLDILKIVPGIGVSMNTGYNVMGIESRGTKSIYSEKILVMVDGHRVNELLSGGISFAFDDMMVENIKRVEVIRGPGSALHGANAFVAAINVVTKESEDIDGLDIRAGGGSFGTQHYNLQLGKEISDFKIAAFFDYMDANGARLFVGQDAIGQRGRTQDWRNKYDLGLKMSYGDFSFNGRYVNRDWGPYIGVANALNDESKEEFSQLFGEINYKRSVGENFQLLVKAYYDEFHHRQYWEIFSEGAIPGYPNGFIGIPELKNRTLGSEVQVDCFLGDNNTLTLGALYEYRKQYDTKHSTNFNPFTGAPLGSMQNITSWANWQKNEFRKVKALYLQHVWEITPDLEVTSGVRYDKYSDVGDTMNPRAALVWNFLKKGTLKLLFGSAFRAPNFVELYNSSNPAEIGNPDLKPETIKTYEASVGYQFHENLWANATYFHNNIKDAIGRRTTTYENLGRVTVDGVEVEVKVNFENSNYGYANYTWQHPRDSDTGERVPYVSTHKGNVGFNLGLCKYLNLNSNLLVVSSRPLPATSTRPDFDGYKVLDMTLIAKNFYNNLELRASVHNLLDEDYADPDISGAFQGNLPREGISFILEARYKF